MNANMEKLEERRKKTSITNMYFNRFLLIRYTTALFLFFNLYWFVFLLFSQPLLALLPFALFAGAAVVALEQVKLYRNHSQKLPYARFFYMAQGIVNVGLIGLIYTPAYANLFPFLTKTMDTKRVLTCALLIGILISLVVLRKLYKIRLGQDKHLKLVKAYEKTLS